MEKEFAVKMRNCMIFRTFECISDLLTRFSIRTKQTLLGTFMLKVESKLTRTSYDTYET